METYEAKKNRILKAKEIASNANPGKAKRLKPGESRIWEKIKAEAKPKIEKREKKVKVVRRRKLSPETILAGELSDKGIPLREIALKIGLRSDNVARRIEVWEKYKHIN